MFTGWWLSFAITIPFAFFAGTNHSLGIKGPMKGYDVNR